MAELKKHGNLKYRFDKLKEEGDFIRVKPSSLNSLKTAFRTYLSREGEDFKVKYDEYANGYVNVVRIEETVSHQPL